MAAKKKVKPSDIIKKVQKKADTHPRMSHVTASDCSRVISVLFQEVAKLPSDEALGVLARFVALGKAKTKA